MHPSPIRWQARSSRAQRSQDLMNWRGVVISPCAVSRGFW